MRNKLFIIGCIVAGFSFATLNGCSNANDLGVIDDGKKADNLGKENSKNLEIGTVVDKIPDANILDKEDKGYLAYYELYQKNDAGEWFKNNDAYSLSDGDINIGYERHNEAKTIKKKCIGYMIVPIKYEKVDGEWKKYGKDLVYTESDEWVEMENKIRTDEELENSQK